MRSQTRASWTIRDLTHHTSNVFDFVIADLSSLVFCLFVCLILSLITGISLKHFPSKTLSYDTIVPFATNLLQSNSIPVSHEMLHYPKSLRSLSWINSCPPCSPPAMGYGATTNKKSIDQAAIETVSLWLLTLPCLSASLSICLFTCQKQPRSHHLALAC